MQSAVEAITIRGDKGSYRFEVTWHEGSQKYHGTCDLGEEGRLWVAGGRDILLLMVEIVQIHEAK